MKFNFSTSLENVTVPAAEIKIGKIDISISMEMEDEAYNSLVEMMYEQLNGLFGGSVSIKPAESEVPPSGWQVYCWSDDRPGEYERASKRTFATEEEAKQYASTIAASREAFVTAAIV